MWIVILKKGFPGSSVGKESACNAGDLGSIPGWGRSHGEGKKHFKEYFLFSLPEVWRTNRIYKDNMWSDLFNHNPGGCYQEIIDLAQ